MHLHVQLLGEFKRRASLLTQEVDKWELEVDNNVLGMGLHQSQVKAVKLMLEEMQKKQNATLGALTPALDPEAFAKRRVQLDMEIAATHGILSVFRMMLLQREETTFYRQVLDTADLVAANAYRKVLERAGGWGVIEPKAFRAPPLSYLNATTSAQAYTRGHSFNALRLPLQGSKELKLPVPIISLPFHHARVLWALCAVHHEVGHIVDQDLGLRAALRPALEGALGGSANAGIWRLWLGELIGDVFGILLGGTGFARSMTKVVLKPKSTATRLEAGARHPAPYVRMFIIAALLRASGVADAEPTATELEQEWQQRYDPQPELAPFLAECPAVAAALLDTPLPALADHKLHDFMTTAEMNADSAVAKKLDFFFRDVGPKPPVAQTAMRLVPVGAERAVHAVSAHPNAEDKFATIQDKALAYAKDIRQSGPQFLANADDDLTPENADFLRGLVDALDFSEEA